MKFVDVIREPVHTGCYRDGQATIPARVTHDDFP